MFALVTVCVGALIIGQTRHGYFDFRLFREAGDAVLDGRSPYPSSTSREVRENAAFVYPLPAAWAFVPFALLPLELSEYLYLGLSILAVLCGLRMLRVSDPVVYACTILSSSFIHSLQLGTVNALLFLGICAVWRFRHDAVVLGVVSALLIVMKLFLAPLLVFVLFRSTRAVAICAGVVAVLFVASLLGGFHPVAYVKLLRALADHEALHSMSLAATLHELGWSSTLPLGAALVIPMVLIAIGVLAHLRGADERLLYATCLVASIAAPPIVWNHYFFLLFVPAALAARPRLAALGAFVASWVITWVAVDAVNVRSPLAPLIPPHGPKIAMQLLPMGVLLGLYSWWAVQRRDSSSALSQTRIRR
jgi:hypothetical protein